jgi:hypothetical protein
MLAVLRMSKFKPVVAALYAVAMLMLGFAQLLVRAPAGASSQAVAAALPDGTTIAICGQAPDTPSGKRMAKHCDACCLTAASGLIPSPAVFVEAPELSTKLPPPPALSSPAKTAALEPQSRGPPSA